MSQILAPLRPTMTTPELLQCSDNQYHHIIFGIGPYIADYPEQVLISGVVQNWCGRCIAFPSDLDAGGPSRTTDLMDTIAEETTATVAWENWGVNVNTTVGSLYSILFS
ncbi:hypothetical protein JVT61DRAFT_3319 [Boletus reticuloceps]|uniref:Uncharacterized protein n=1 Tax=Boletus reticuloceps TaxID=495285 RepID=A0A8I2YPF6_9AGAM|nr:hypothetical protein JVT61DRAFT_3319 [Boletus reticuloceps]